MCDIILTFLISVGASVVGCLYNMLSEHKSQSLFQMNYFRCTIFDVQKSSSCRMENIKIILDKEKSARYNDLACVRVDFFVCANAAKYNNRR